MPRVGEPYTNVVEISSGGDEFVTAGAGNSIKVTLLEAYEVGSELPANDDVKISPQDEEGDMVANGGAMPDARAPTPLVEPESSTNTGYSQLYMTDDHGIYMESESDQTVKVVIQGMRVA